MKDSGDGLPSADAELWSLVESFVEGAATSNECQRLETRLRGDESARRFYVAYLDLHAQLQWRTRGKSDRAAAARLPLPLGQGTVLRRRRLMWSSLAAIFSLATAAVVFLP